MCLFSGACLELCKNTPNCKYYNYIKENQSKLCVLLEDIPDASAWYIYLCQNHISYTLYVEIGWQKKMPVQNTTFQNDIIQYVKLENSTFFECHMSNCHTSNFTLQRCRILRQWRCRLPPAQVPRGCLLQQRSHRHLPIQLGRRLPHQLRRKRKYEPNSKRDQRPVF
jgi:hypothetical protein